MHDHVSFCFVFSSHMHKSLSQSETLFVIECDYARKICWRSFPWRLSDNQSQKCFSDQNKFQTTPNKKNFECCANKFFYVIVFPKKIETIFTNHWIKKRVKMNELANDLGSIYQMVKSQMVLEPCLAWMTKKYLFHRCHSVPYPSIKTTSLWCKK